MKNEIIKDLSDFIDMPTPDSVKWQIVERFVIRRKEQKISRKELSNRSGVSYASIRRFEEKGEIAFHSLLALARTINCLTDFNHLFTTPHLTNLKERYDKEYK